MNRKLLKYLNFYNYAKSIGVNLSEDTRLIGNKIDFGSEPYLISIGNHVTISNNVQFITHDGGTWVFRDREEYRGVVKFGRIVVGDNCFIGSHSILMPNINIGNNVVVAAGSIVTKSIPDNCVVAGNPAKYICSIDEYAEKSKMKCPKYDINNYKSNKKEEVLKICAKQEFKENIRKTK